MKITLMCFLALVVGWSRSGAAIPILDQSQLDFSSGEFVQGNISVAQTFTPSITGDLASLDLYIANHDTAEGKPLIVSICDTVSGLPGNQLGTVDLNNIGQNYTWYSLDFSSLDISLNANTQYAFVLSCPGTFYGVYPAGSVNPNSYTGGMALIQNGIGASWQPDGRAPQLVFETYMTIPEPCSIGLLLLGGGLLGVRRFRFGGSCAVD